MVKGRSSEPLQTCPVEQGSSLMNEPAAEPSLLLSNMGLFTSARLLKLASEDGWTQYTGCCFSGFSWLAKDSFWESLVYADLFK